MSEGKPETIAGVENVFDDEESLEEYSADSSFAPRVRPGRIFKPRTAEEVRSIVKWANQTKTPLVPVSSGPPHFYGDTVPGVGGTAVVDLSGMKQIVRVDRRNRVAMVEPGVTFGELIPALKREGLEPLMPLAPRSSKSVVTAFLERTPITTPRFHWESQDPLLCVEVIYGNGDSLRTGSAAGPGTLEEQWEVGRAQMRGMGPSQVDFTRLLQGAQGTMGIVVWATVRCKPAATVKRLSLAPSEDIAPLIEMAYEITYKKLGEELFILNSANLASLLEGDGAEIRRLRDRLPPWALVLGIEGAGLLPEEKVAYQTEECAELAQRCGLELKTAVAGARAGHVSRVLARPSGEPYRKLRLRGGCCDIFFLTTLDKAADFIGTARQLGADRDYPLEDMGVYIQPIVQGANAHLEFNFNFDPRSPAETRKVRELVEQGGEVLANMGAFFSRPYGTWARFAYGREAQSVIAQRKLKSIFDPNGILNPGKLCF